MDDTCMQWSPQPEEGPQVGKFKIRSSKCHVDDEVKMIKAKAEPAACDAPEFCWHDSQKYVCHAHPRSLVPPDCHASKKLEGGCPA